MLRNGKECGKIKIVRILRQPSAVQIMIDNKQSENVDYFTSLGSMVTDDVYLKLNP